MARKSRRGKKSSRRNLYLSIAVVVILVVAIGAVYDIEARGGTKTTSSSSSTSSGTGEYAVLDTTQGNITIQLFPADAPKTVANFVNLANTGFYNDLVWHRIVAGFIIQTGDPNTKGAPSDESNWGQGGSGTTIPFENSGLPEGEYYVAMANTIAQGDGASSQFFINLVNNVSSLGSGYAVFGMVVQGMNAVQAIGALPVASTCSSSNGLTCPPLNPGQALLISVTIQSTP
jgi:cyclophilin family peptidyl-prolyl cis-trans isomerase